ncbi:MAG TPA: type II toxin-antitoxin system RelE/ParE family toxin [Thermotogota bacterium]|nr:type II toxin-antitoxin system RelE/ParE family toxin [Thermotogota bacterium]HPJ88674.1 type II toxin-antitoxin system RelE/ParE family toxin [Thermotogota bacterium]
MYEIKFTTAAKKYFKKIVSKELKKEFQAALSNISVDPYIGSRKTGDLKEFYGYDVFYSGTNYEIAYLIFETPEQKVVIVLAGTRENFYEQLKRYTK